MTFLNLSINPIFIFCIIFSTIFFSYIEKGPKIYQLHIVKKIKKDYKKACERCQNLSKEEKKATIWL